MWFFGSWIDAQHVAVVGVRVKPGYGSNPADRIQVNLLDPGCDVILQVAQVADEASDGQDVGSVLAPALQVGHLLDKPIRLDGEGRADGGPLAGRGSTVASQNDGDLSAPAGLVDPSRTNKGGFFAPMGNQNTKMCKSEQTPILAPSSMLP